MQVKEIMSREVEVIHSNIPVRAAAARMKTLNIGFLPVRDADRLVGMVTDRDIVVRAVAGGKDPSKTKVEDILTPDVIYCFEDQDVGEAAKLMQEKRIRRLIVLNRDKRLAGILSVGDLAVATGSDKLTGETVKHVSE
ncbi:MAG TPA: CBS domain-containing protein [Candidatus Binatia bacterium]|nr:CBS domain-containing protein [Candidatus Binatia bacterium]